MPPSGTRFSSTRGVLDDKRKGIKNEKQTAMAAVLKNGDIKIDLILYFGRMWFDVSFDL